MEGEAGRRHGGPVKVAHLLLLPLFLLYNLLLFLLAAITGIFNKRGGGGRGGGHVLGEHLDIRRPTAEPHV